MQDIQKLIAILELTREQPQYGYLLTGIPLNQTSNLAEHHYLVTWIGLLLAKIINKQGGKVNEQRVMELCLMHDLGELFGGDVNGPLSRKFPALKTAAQAMEDMNFGFLVEKTQQAGLDEWLRGLWSEEGGRQTDESVIEKVADLMETAFFLEHRSKQSASKAEFFRQHIKPLAEKMQDQVARQVLMDFFAAFEQVIAGKSYQAENFILGE